MTLSAQLLWNYPTNLNETWYTARTSYVVMHFSKKYWSSKFYGSNASDTGPDIIRSNLLYIACFSGIRKRQTLKMYWRRNLIFYCKKYAIGANNVISQRVIGSSIINVNHKPNFNTIFCNNNYFCKLPMQFNFYFVDSVF